MLVGMTLKDVLEISTAVILSLGGGSGIVLGLSNYIGKRWADRALEKQKQEYTKLNIEFSNQLDIAKRRLQIELDALGHLHKLRTQAEFEKLQELWKRIVTLRQAFWDLPKAGFAFRPREKEKQKEFNVKSSQRFLDVSQDAQLFLNEQALAVPKPIADAANSVLRIAHSELAQVIMYPDPFDPDAMGQLDPETRRQFFDDRIKNMNAFDTESDKLEQMMRDYLQGREAAQPKTAQ
jgi:hypothetical protein